MFYFPVAGRLARSNNDSYSRDISAYITRRVMATIRTKRNGYYLLPSQFHRMKRGPAFPR